MVFKNHACSLFYLDNTLAKQIKTPSYLFIIFKDQIQYRMIIVISPSKSMDFDSEWGSPQVTEPQFTARADELARVLQGYSQTELSQLMGISEKLADLNYTRFQNWFDTDTQQISKPALLAYTGDVYAGLKAKRFDEEDLAFAQKHLRILSGMYGSLRPLDRIRPYRLEFGTELPVQKHPNLYEYWGSTVTESLQTDMENSKAKVLVNLASKEYYKSVKPKLLGLPVISPNFKELRDDKYKFISFNAKRARGMMAAYIIQNRLENVEDLKSFDTEGYSFNESLSNEKDWIFTK